MYRAYLQKAVFCLFIGLCCGPLNGCSPSTEDLMKGQTDVALFEQGKGYFERKEYKTALSYFLYVKEHFIRSSLAATTRFYAGECYFAQEEYADAATEYQGFLMFFADDPLAAEAQYKLGVSYLEQSRGPERDQTMLQKALTELQKVRERYPDKQDFIQKADISIRETREELAQHEYSVAHFYAKEKQYASSNHRLEYLLREYPDASVLGDALCLKGSNHIALNQPAEAKTAFTTLIQTYPQHACVAEAQKHLQQLGGSPR